MESPRVAPGLWRHAPVRWRRQRFGRDDHVTPYGPARAYWEKVRSRGKAFAAIDGGHYACFTDTGQFLRAMRKYAVPLAT